MRRLAAALESGTELPALQIGFARRGSYRLVLGPATAQFRTKRHFDEESDLTTSEASSQPVKKSGSSTLLVGENVVFVQRGRIRAANLECGSLLPLSDWGRFTGNKAAASRRTPKSHGLHRGETPAGRAASDP